MRFQELRDYIATNMRMSHIYQPVMLIELLRNRGHAHQSDIAKSLVTKDQSQIEYYTKITNNMVGKVLRNHKIVERDPSTKVYSLIGFDDLTDKEIDELITLCEKRLSDFISARGDKIFSHRMKSSGYISGTIRYEVLKRAEFRCELCGISAEEKALEVDHILPRNQGGPDEIDNYQALCYSCNAMKRDMDSTDFRGNRKQYDERQDGCLFCEVPKSRTITENALAYVIRDGYPVTQFHTLIIPKRHIATYFELNQAEINACNRLLAEVKEDIEKQDSTVGGFNIGINAGKSAGQTIFHCHIHIIPRRMGDVPDPRGGVRHTIPGKGNY